MQKRKIDMSCGDPLYPFRSAARYAFAQAAQDLNRYQFMAQGRSKPEITRTYSAISDHFTARGLKPPGWTGLSYGHFTMTGGGTTEAYNLVIQHLAADVRARNAAYGATIKPVILMPVPTYGFFMQQPEREGIEIRTLDRPQDGKGHITPEHLLSTIRDIDSKGERIIAYYDSNPNNPLGIIRGESETRALADIFLRLKEHYRRRDQQDLEKWQQDKPGRVTELFGEPHTIKPGRIWDGPASRVRIIDDIVYEGLEYGAEKPFAFAQIPELFKDTFTLAGPSKAGLVNLRAGVLIGDDHDIRDIEQRRSEHNYFPARVTLAGLEAYYSPEPSFVSAREKHLTRMNREHRFRGLFMKALINGLDSITEATPQDRRRIIAAYAKLENVPAEKAKAALARGIPGVKITTTPESGFFHLVDFSALRGSVIRTEHSLSASQIFSGHYDLQNLLSVTQNIGIASAGWMGLPGDALITRATFAAPLEDILEYSKRLRAAAAQIKQPAPSSPAAAPR